MSRGKSAKFLPVGKDFTIPARFFLPVGNAGDLNGVQRVMLPVNDRCGSGNPGYPGGVKFISS